MYTPMAGAPLPLDSAPALHADTGTPPRPPAGSEISMTDLMPSGPQARRGAGTAHSTLAHVGQAMMNSSPGGSPSAARSLLPPGQAQSAGGASTPAGGRASLIPAYSLDNVSASRRGTATRNALAGANPLIMPSADKAHEVRRYVPGKGDPPLVVQLAAAGGLAKLSIMAADGSLRDAVVDSRTGTVSPRGADGDGGDRFETDMQGNPTLAYSRKPRVMAFTPYTVADYKERIARDSAMLDGIRQPSSTWDPHGQSTAQQMATFSQSLRAISPSGRSRRGSNASNVGAPYARNMRSGSAGPLGYHARRPLRDSKQQADGFMSAVGRARSPASRSISGAYGGGSPGALGRPPVLARGVSGDTGDTDGGTDMSSRSGRAPPAGIAMGAVRDTMAYRRRAASELAGGWGRQADDYSSQGGYYTPPSPAGMSMPSVDEGAPSAGHFFSPMQTGDGSPGHGGYPAVSGAVSSERGYGAYTYGAPGRASMPAEVAGMSSITRGAAQLLAPPQPHVRRQRLAPAAAEPASDSTWTPDTGASNAAPGMSAGAHVRRQRLAAAPSGAGATPSTAGPLTSPMSVDGGGGRARLRLGRLARLEAAAPQDGGRTAGPPGMTSQLGPSPSPVMSPGTVSSDETGAARRRSVLARINLRAQAPESGEGTTV